MKTLHTKSPCCQGKIYHFGNRRRQCSVCQRTWSVHQKKRGRKHHRINKNILNKTLIQGQPLKFQLRRDYASIDVLYKRFRQSLLKLYRQPRNYSFPRGKLILLGDGLWFSFKAQEWVLYVVALKSVNKPEAIILDPLLLAGKENYEGWQKTVKQIIPKSIKKRIIAFVSDNFRGSKKLSYEENWIHQLCHFHLLARLQAVRGKRKTTLSNRNLREKIYQNIHLALQTQDEKELKLIRQRLRRWIRHRNQPKKIGSIAREFLREIKSYRAYLSYPELNLPTTTNSIESLNTKIRKTTRNLKNPESVQLWAVALIRMLVTITCNGKNFQQN